jgi:hypothetical protein
MTTEFRYQDKRKGDGIVKAFQRLLQTGDVQKITPGLYHALTMHGGFIAHFGLHGFRAYYRGRLTELLAGEMDPLTDPDRFRRPALEDSGYSDGMSAGDVMRDIATIGKNGGDLVREREARQRAEAEVELARQLAAKHGLTVS